MSIIVEKLREWRCNKIFLATEEKNIVQIFKQVFRDTCVTFDKPFVDYAPGKIITEFHIDRQDDRYLQGKEYLTEMVLLSTCNSMVAAQCNGTFFAALTAENFEHTYIFNLGKYGMIGLD